MLSQLVKSTTRYYTVQFVLCITLKVGPHLDTACRQLCNFYLELICRNMSLRFQAPRSSKAAPVAVLVPEYEGPISNPFASSQQTDLGGVVFVDCHATIGSQSAVHASTADIVPSEAGMAPDISSSDQLDTALTALDRVAQPPSLQSSASVDMSPLALGQPDLCFFDASDSQDYMAYLAEALARLCKRASEDGQGHSASQAVTDYQQHHMHQVTQTTLSLSAAAAAIDADAAADSPQSSAGPEENLNTACSVSAGDASETVSDGHMAMADALMSSEVQHAEVDQVVDDLLDEVSACLEPVQSSMPADSAADIVSGDIAAMVVVLESSQVQHAAVDQVVDDLLDEVAAPLQTVQSSIPADISGMISPRVSPTVSLPAESSEDSVEDLNSGCSESTETISADHLIVADALMTRGVQHAAVDQVLEELLDEVSAPLQAVQSSMPADISGRVSPIVNLPANSVIPPQHAAVDQVLDELLAEVSAPLQAVQSSMPADTSGRVTPVVTLRVSLLANSFAPPQADSSPAVPAPDSCYVSSTTHSHPLPPVATAAKRTSPELSPVVPSSSKMSGKENSPVVEARHVSKEVKQVVGAMGRGRGRVCYLDRSTFQEMAQALPTEPSSQVVQLTVMSLPQRCL